MSRRADRNPRRRAGIAVDIGGSKIASAASDAPHAVHHLSTGADRGSAVVGERVVAAIQHWRVSPGERIVVASAGDLDRVNGRIITAANLPWQNFALADTVADATGGAVELIGDATAAALAELTHPARASHRNGIYVTVSTGIGMGVMRQGQLDWQAGIGDRELGHVQVDTAHDAEPCGCGRRGCLEAYSSGRALARRYRQSLRPMSDDQRVPVAADVINAARQGDLAARQVLDEALNHLARALVAAAAEIDATVVVLGGGVMVHTELFSEVRRRLHVMNGIGVEVERSAYGIHSTIHGAAALCERQDPVMAAWGQGGLTDG